MLGLQENLTLDYAPSATVPIGTRKKRYEKTRLHPELPDVYLCTHCYQYKTKEDFHKRLDSVAYMCKECSVAYCAANSQRRIDSGKIYKKNNEVKVRARAKKYRENNREKITERQRKHLAKPEVRTRTNARWVERKNTIPQVAIRARMKDMVRRTLCRGGKGGRMWQELVDYTVEDLRKHLQKKFTPGMTWEKFLKGEIHIDHVIPIKAFNITSYKDHDFKRCWELKNLQPLWAHDNVVKNCKLEKPFQPALL
jgi:hypothetical protein